MRIKTGALLTFALCLASASHLVGQSQDPITKQNTVTSRATIQAIDSTGRTVTLKDAKGNEDTYRVNPAVQRFNEFKVGDTVRTTYIESLVMQIRKAGEKPGETATDAAVTRGEGALPAGTAGVQEKMTITVKSIDPEFPSITVTTPDNRTVTRRVENKKNLEGVQVGDLIDITYTRAVIMALERGE